MVKISVLAALMAAALVSAAPTKQPVCKNSVSNFQLFTTCSRVCDVYKPKTVEEIQNIIRNAAKAGRGVRAVAAKHTYTDNLCKLDADIIEMGAMDSVLEINKEEGYVIVEAGTRFTKLAAALALKGMSYGWATVAYPLITVGGALANGGHHTGWKNVEMTVPGATLAVEIVNAAGEVEQITGGERLAAVRTNLGLLGVVTKVKYAVHDARLLTVGFDSAKVSEVIETGFGPTLDTTDSMLAWFFPPLKRVVTFKMDRIGNAPNISVPVPLPADAVQSSISKTYFDYFEQSIKCSTGISRSSTCDTDEAARKTFVAKEDNVVTASAMFDDFSQHLRRFMPKINLPIGIGDDEFAIPFKRHREAIALIRDIFDKYPDFDLGLKGASIVFPLVQFRFATPDETTYLANNALTSNLWSEGAVWFEIWYLVTQKNENEVGKLRRAVKDALMGPQVLARPHWAKGREATFEGGIGHLYEGNFAKFQKVMREMDPTGMFYNGFAQRAGL
ncbi:hypothetical protein DFJ77DRAFT_471283 [Powellomyces hirtus]|nr:hypothetical protein DFJ77DRAFT_471283 [Powellomyces hirtus]